jgi:glucose/arabinose dehydrogenase
VSAIHFYTGARFPKWRNQLLVASLARQELHLLRIESGRVTKDEVLLRDAGRIRDVRVGPDGYPYVLLTTLSGAIYRLGPSISASSRCRPREAVKEGRCTAAVDRTSPPDAIDR